MKKIPLPLKLAALAAALIQVGCATAPEPAIDVRTVNVALADSAGARWVGVAAAVVQVTPLLSGAGQSSGTSTTAHTAA